VGGFPPPPPVFATKPVERYPMRYEVAYPERLSRWKALLRGILVLPVQTLAYIAFPVLFAGLVLGWTTVFWRKTYPGWLFQAVAGSLAFLARMQAYGILLTDRYPSFDVDLSPVALEYDDPPNGHLSRWRVFWWKLFLLIPHFFVLSFLFLAANVVTVIAWFAILFTGRYPRGLFGFVTGVNRWYFRTWGYFASFNDRFPPFALSPDAGPGSGASVVINAVIGVLVGGACIAVVTTAAIVGSQRDDVSADYAALKEGRPGSAATVFMGGIDVPSAVLSLRKINDPDANLARALGTPDGYRAVVFDFVLTFTTDPTNEIGRDFGKLEFTGPSGDHSVRAAATLIDGLPAPKEAGTRSTVRVAFVIPLDARPTTLVVDPPWQARTLNFNFK
jgi:hypothetical protein